MRRRMRMKEIENIKFKRIDNLRAAIADIHESRESKALLDKDDTPYSQPVLQSLQAIVGLELSKDIKTFNGTETVNLNSSLLDIPLIEETVNIFTISSFQILYLEEGYIWNNNEVARMFSRLQIYNKQGLV